MVEIFLSVLPAHFSYAGLAVNGEEVREPSQSGPGKVGEALEMEHGECLCLRERLSQSLEGVVVIVNLIQI